MNANLKLAAEGAEVDAWLVLMTSDGWIGVEGLDEAVGARVRALAGRRAMGGEAGSWAIDDASSPAVVVVGVGVAEEVDVRGLHRAAGVGVEALTRCRAGRVGVAAGRSAVGAIAGDRVAEALGEGMELAGWRYHAYRSAGEASTVTELTAPSAAGRDGLASGIAWGGSGNYARQLAAAPPNLATPLYLAEKAEALADATGLSCRVFQGAELEEREMVGLVNVGKGSDQPPCLIELVHEPAGLSADAPTIALVGKSITFDAGGLSLKIEDTMRYMKYDMSGGAAVMGAMHAAARLGLPLRVVGLLPAAENVVGRGGFRVDDILAYPNGVSVEVTNTDFEGRLVLADALIHANREHRPSDIVDLGTLTGEVVTVLGHDTAGLWSNDAGLVSALGEAGEASGEPVWPMPLNAEHRRLIRDSFHADMVNRNLEGPGKSCQCAAFLEPFALGEGRPRWSHLDIAGPVHVVEGDPPYAPGPTGFGARLLGRWLVALG